jgi:hypothetical protein
MKESASSSTGLGTGWLDPIGRLASQSPSEFSIINKPASRGQTSERSQEAAAGGAVVVPLWLAIAPWLAEALEELESCPGEAKEIGASEPSGKARGNARAIIDALARMVPPLLAPSVYPTAESEIAILFRSEAQSSAVLLLCDSDGGGACFSTMGGKNVRARYDDASQLPDEFVKSQIRRLGIT